MILKQEITSIAANMNLLPTTVEKDYVLSWVLNGISAHPKLSEWLFKGGTCLKKCYFETYRFSEDLDFTVPAGTIYDQEEIRTALDEVADIVYQQTGINLKTREIEVKESINKRNGKTYVAKFTYLGPLNLASRAQQRIKFDITDDEIIFDTPDIREVFHPYSDAPNSSTRIKCYSINEILSEKTRAIFERQGRVRDIYDIVNISRNFREHIDIKKSRLGLKEKFKFKQLPEPTVALISSTVNFEQLAANWSDQLKHQVQLLPPVESFYNDLPAALSWWMDENSSQLELKPISRKENETILQRDYFPERTFIHTRKPNSFSSPHIIEKIRYAARNRLCIEIQYHGYTRLIEPYSLQRPKTGNVLLYAHEITKGGKNTNDIRNYKIHEIVLANITSQIFSPRYAVEL